MSKIKLIIRPARPEDFDRFVALMPELETGDPIPSAAVWREEMVADTLIAERAGLVIGYCFGQQVGAVGRVRHLVTAPEARRTGAGKALLDSQRQRFRALGLQCWDLNVKPDNHAAIALYEGAGMRALFRATALGIPWSLVATLPEPPGPLRTSIVAPEDDASCEQALRLPAGQLDSQRRLPQRVVLGLWRAATPTGVAVFHPGFPGAYPFRVVEPALAPALLHGLKPHALPEHNHLGVFIEDDEATAAMLRAAGATLRLQAIHYEGIP